MTSESRQWLERLETTPDAFALLLQERGELYLAAYELAQRKCMCMGRGTVPTAVEVWSAAREVVERSNKPLFVPCSRVLRSLCEEAGLPVV